MLTHMQSTITHYYLKRIIFTEVISTVSCLGQDSMTDHNPLQVGF